MPGMLPWPRGMLTSKVAIAYGPAESGGAKLPGVAVQRAEASSSARFTWEQPVAGSVRARRAGIRSPGGRLGRRRLAVFKDLAAGLAGRAVVGEYLAVPDHLDCGRAGVTLSALAAMDFQVPVAFDRQFDLGQSLQVDDGEGEDFLDGGVETEDFLGLEFGCGLERRQSGFEEDFVGVGFEGRVVDVTIEESLDQLVDRGRLLDLTVGNRELVDAFWRLKTNLDSGMFGAVQAAAAEALSGPQDSVKQMCEVYRRRRDLLIGALRRIGLHAESPKGTIYLEQADVIVSPGAAYGPSGEGYVRLSLTVPDERLEEAVHRIEERVKF